jgi:hypothetical protein
LFDLRKLVAWSENPAKATCQIKIMESLATVVGSAGIVEELRDLPEGHNFNLSWQFDTVFLIPAMMDMKAEHSASILECLADWLGGDLAAAGDMWMKSFMSLCETRQVEFNRHSLGLMSEVHAKLEAQSNLYQPECARKLVEALQKTDGAAKEACAKLDASVLNGVQLNPEVEKSLESLKEKRETVKEMIVAWGARDLANRPHVQESKGESIRGALRTLNDQCIAPAERKNPYINDELAALIKTLIDPNFSALAAPAAAGAEAAAAASSSGAKRGAGAKPGTGAAAKRAKAT